jgi:hypothetical protein
LNLVRSAAADSEKMFNRTRAVRANPTGNIETRDSLLILKLEAESLSVVVEDLDFRQLQVHPSLVTTSEDLGALSGRLSGRGVVPVQSDTKAGKTDGQVDGGQGLALGRLGGVFTEALDRRQN